MAQYTAEQIKELTKVFWWPLRTCSICNVAVGYYIHPQKELVAFDSSCSCSNLTGWRERSWQDIADTVNMQSEETQTRMLKELAGEL